MTNNIINNKNEAGVDRSTRYREGEWSPLDAADGLNSRLSQSITSPSPRHSFRIIRASTEQQIRWGRQLAYRVYLAKGYVRDKWRGEVSFPNDLCGESYIFLAENAQGGVIGTASAFSDAAFGLPCDEVFGAELDTLRRGGRRPMEIARLAVCPKEAHPQSLLRTLFNHLYVGAYRVSGATDFVIEVNPRHEAYYRRRLGFERVAGPRPCPRVQGAPALLLRLDLRWVARQIRRSRFETHLNTRTLYPEFLSKRKEKALVDHLRKGGEPVYIHPGASSLGTSRQI